MTNPGVAVAPEGGTAWWRRPEVAYRTLSELLRRPASLVGILLLLLVLAVAGFGPLVAPWGPEEIDAAVRLQGPSSAHWLGTDDYGRDVLSRLLTGARYTLWISFASVLGALIVGTITGALGAYFGGWLDEAIGRAMDVLLTFPGIFLGLAIVAASGPKVNNVILAVGVVGIPRFARMARGGVLSTKACDFVEAARAMGASHSRILFRHVLPNCTGPLVVFATLWSGTAVLHASGLSFLGVGVQPPTPEWGAMLADAQRYVLTQPSLTIFPGLAISVLVLGLNLLGDGLRDYLDPRTRGREQG